MRVSQTIGYSVEAGSQARRLDQMIPYSVG
jgi:hypothetical protein